MTKKRKLLPLFIGLSAITAIGISVPFIVTSCSLNSTITTPINVDSAKITELENDIREKIKQNPTISIDAFNNEMQNNQQSSVNFKRYIANFLNKNGSTIFEQNVIGTIRAVEVTPSQTENTSASSPLAKIVIESAPGFSFNIINEQDKTQETNNNIVLKNITFGTSSSSAK